MDAEALGKLLKLGGTTLQGNFLLYAEEAFPENKKGTSLIVAESWGHVPPGS